MIEKQQLNEMVADYQRTHSDETFTEIYRIVHDKLFGNERTLAVRGGLDEWDIAAAQDDALLKAVDTYDIAYGDFENHLNNALTNRRIDLSRRKEVRSKHEMLIAPEEDEDEAATFDRLTYGAQVTQAAATADVAEEIIATKKESDQWHLIESLTKNIDSSTAEIVGEILSDRTLGKFSPTAIGYKLNVHHSVVSRKLRRLAKEYDSKSFGDYRDFLSVC